MMSTITKKPSFEKQGVNRAVLFDKNNKQYWAYCNDGFYRPCAVPISRWPLVIEWE